MIITDFLPPGAIASVLPRWLPDGGELLAEAANVGVGGDSSDDVAMELLRADVHLA